tara:strand:+ start:230 stop:493 length:264 start_codon:yes stop_codon:yes gene_type:complete
MKKECVFCNTDVDINCENVTDHQKLIIQMQNIVCSECEETKISYKCEICDKIVNQNVATSKTIFGCSFKLMKQCLDCNSQMTEEILQ